MFKFLQFKQKKVVPENPEIDLDSIHSFICSPDNPKQNSLSNQVASKFSTYSVVKKPEIKVLGRRLPSFSWIAHFSPLFGALYKEVFKIVQFLITFNLYIHHKLVQAKNRIVLTKDAIVRGLLWRRGKLFRPITHAGVVGLAVVAVVAGNIVNSSKVEAVDVTDEVLRANNVAETTIPEGRPRSEVITYQVLGGDTLSLIAEKFNVSNDSIVWANGLSDPNSIAPGDLLKIPPVTGIVYTVKKGDRLEEIAKKYQANPQAIVDFPFNDIGDNFALKEGQLVVIPDGVKPGDPAPAPKAAPKSSNNLASAPDSNPVRTASGFMWPVNGLITQYDSWYHPGAWDIQAAYGSPVHASAAGRVIVSQKLNYGYGWHIVIDHGNGYTTLYGHMLSLTASVGQSVDKGQVIGLEGNTGRSTGPHVHFEVHRNGVAVSPRAVLGSR